MTGVTSAWAVSGLALGVGHALSLWRATRRPAWTSGPSGVLRLAGVGMLLLVAAATGGLLPAAIGWGLGFPATVLVLLLRARTP